MNDYILLAIFWAITFAWLTFVIWVANRAEFTAALRERRWHRLALMGIVATTAITVAVGVAGLK